MAQYQPMYDSFNRLPERYVPTARMSVSPNVFLPGSDVDLNTGELKMDRRRRHRTQSQRLEQQEIEQEERKIAEALERESRKRGVRIESWKGWLILTALLFVCAMTLLAQQGQISKMQKKINDQEAVIARYRQENTLLEDQIAAASDPAVICYAASQDLHMIPASSAKAIYLEAVDTRPLETAKKHKKLAAAAQEEQTPSTPVPMTASGGY